MPARALMASTAVISTTSHRRAGPTLPTRVAGASFPALAPRVHPRRRPIAVVSAARKARSGSDLASLATEDVNFKAPPALTPVPVPPKPVTLADRAATAARASVAVALAVALLAQPALAAGSGGRIGGSGGFSAARSAPSYSAPRSYGSAGGGARYESRTAPPLRVAPRALNGVGLGWGLIPFGGYGGFGYGYPVAVGGGGGGLGDLFVLGLFAFVGVTILSSLLNNRADEADDDAFSGSSSGRVTVAKLQVGLLGSARGLQRDLDRIAGKADTSSPSGLHYVLQETVLALLRNPQYAIYGASATRNTRSLAAGESAFNEASLEERGKLAEETLVNVGGRARSGTYSKGGAGGGGVGDDDELVVVTVLVAARGGLALPKVTSGADLRAALNRLGAVPADDVLAVEVLWTPQDPRDKYYRSDAVADYPNLNVL